MIKISTRFDAGSVVVKDLTDPSNIRLALRPDNASDFAQWFYFRLQGAAYQNCIMHFENAAEAAYPKGWEGYQACASYDRRNWFRVPTSYENGVLTVNHTPLSNSVYYAYFEPYSEEQHLNLLGDAQGSGLCRIDDLGSTVQGRDINLLTIGNQVESDMKIWITARQHPGETMAEWLSKAARQAARFARPDSTHPARPRHVLHRPQYESRRFGTGQPSYQRRRCEPQPRMGKPDFGKKPRSVLRARKNAGNRRGFVFGHPRR